MSKSKFYEKTISSKRIYKGRIVGLREDTVRLPDGGISKREIVEHPGAVAIVALTRNKKILLIRQYRKPVEGELMEVPAGLLRKGEKPVDAAGRELFEETGYIAKKISPVLSAYTSPGISSEVLRYFFASDLVEGKQNTEADEFIDVVAVKVRDAVKLIKKGKIKDNKTILGIMLAEKKLKLK